MPYTASEIPHSKVASFDLNKSFLRLGTTAKPVSLATLAQRPGGILVNFWATWCPPCVEELPSLEMLHRQLAAKGDPNLPLIVAISVDEYPAEVHRLFKTLPFQPSFAILLDPDAVFAKEVGTVRFPETYWIGSGGEVRHKWLGPQNWLSDAVQRRLAPP